MGDYYVLYLVVYMFLSIFGVKILYNMALRMMGKSRLNWLIRNAIKYSGPAVWFVLGGVFVLVFIPCP